MYSIDYIHKTLHYYFIEKLSFNKISKILKVSRQIISIWIKYFNNDSLFLTNRNKIKTLKLNNKITNYDIQLFIKKIIYTNPFITRYEIIEFVYLKFKIKLTLNNVSKIYKILNMTRKQPKYHITKSIKFIDELIQKRKFFLDEINKISIDKIISIDECGFNKLLSLKKGLSEKGKQLNIPIKQKINKNISLLLAITNKNILHFQINDENTTSAIFFIFIKEIISKLKESNYTFIFDNINFHHNKIMLKYIISNGHNYIFTPAYSPNNNPVENVFSLIKNKYTKIKYINKDPIIKKIKDILNEITNEFNNFIKIFNRSLTFNYANIEKELRDRISFIN